VSRNQILILVLLVVLVLAIFGVLAYLVFFQGDGADTPATDTPTPAPAVVMEDTATPAGATAPADSKPAPTPTPSPQVAVVVTGDVKSVAKATMEVTAQQTAEAEAKLDAAMQKMPPCEGDLFARAGQLRMTMKHIGWLRIGQLSLKLQFTNMSDEYHSIDPAYLTLVGMDGEEYAVEEDSALPDKLIAAAIEGGDSMTGGVSFRLPLDVAPSSIIYYDDEVYLELDILNWILSEPITTSQ